MRAAVLGRPVGHSLSPVLHTAAYAALGLADWSYTAIDCGEAELPGLLAGLGPDWAGLSLTMPLKRVALAVADSVDPLAAAVGAANTLVLGGGGRRAYTTDVAGIAAALREARAHRAPVRGRARRRRHRPGRAGRAVHARAGRGGGAGARPGPGRRAAWPPRTGSASCSTCAPGCPVRCRRPTW